jgi:hypothetical protein
MKIKVNASASLLLSNRGLRVATELVRFSATQGPVTMKMDNELGCKSGVDRDSNWTVPNVNYSQQVRRAVGK